MRSVSRFESNLLHILRCFLRHTPFTRVQPLLARAVQRPPCLSRDAIELVKDTLAKGCVSVLARGGGWQQERFLQGEQAAEGRLWQRHEPRDLGLAFSQNSLDFLMWVTANNVFSTKTPWKPPDDLPLVSGDRFLMYLAYQALRGTEVARQWCRGRTFRQHALCRLMFAEDFGRQTEQNVPSAPDFTPWLSRSGTAILEALQTQLAEHWIEMERGKAHLVSSERMRRIGESQQVVLDAFLTAMEDAGRWDLARFVLDAAARLLHPPPSPDAWLQSLDVREQRIADRMKTYHAAFAFLRQLDRLQHWERQARGVGYFDEGYAAAQLWKADWESFRGDPSCQAAKQIVQHVEALA